MGQTLIIILVVGALIGAVVFRCKAEFLQPLCDAWPEGESAFDLLASTYNSLPTALDNPKTNEYRSTRIVGRASDPQVGAQLKNQNDFSNPKTATAVKKYIATTNKNAGTPAGGTSGPKGTGYNCNSVLCKNYPSNCPGCNKAKYTRTTSLFTTARLAI